MTAASTAPRLPRGRRGTLAVLASLILVAAAALGATAALQIHQGRRRTVLGDPGTVVRWLRRTEWHDQVVAVVGLVAVVLGVLLLLAAVVPARRRLVELVEQEPQTAIGIPRRALRRDLAATAETVDGIASAEVSLRRRALRVSAASRLRDTSGLSEAVTATLERRLVELAPRRSYTLRVRVRSTTGPVT